MLGRSPPFPSENALPETGGASAAISCVNPVTAGDQSLYAPETCDARLATERMFPCSQRDACTAQELALMRQILWNNGLSIAMFVLFLISIIGQMIAGWWALAEELRFHGLASMGFFEYLTTGHFLSATFENW